ncbi:MAG: dipeptide ABC transporter ATP-binding protein [Bdellovibrionaceae bacterium]|nr:dipeptide ABC transporter ATP-binding protein [Pseudobdellovibrionaceae bacterium]
MASTDDFILEAKGLGKHYELRRLLQPVATVKAVDGVSFHVRRGKTLAIVGESGCGKSTLARLLMRIEAPSFGEMSFSGRDVSAIPAQEFRQSVQMIFQDPYSSLNPRKKARSIIAEPLVVNTNLSATERDARVLEILNKVGLRPEVADRYPHMFSGGQRQRIGIARALMLRPQILICDEPVSALDISIQAQVLNLLMDLQDEFGLSYVFISHDLAVVRHIADDVMVMYLGKVMEQGPREAIFANPQHPYTKMLLSSTPDIAEGLKGQAGTQSPPAGELPSPLNPPPGCPFQKRCSQALPTCSQTMPSLRLVQNRQVACHLDPPN